MTLIEFHADVSRVADALEKIASLLQQLVYPPSPSEVKVQQATLDDLRTVSEEDILRMREEQSDLAQRYNVVLGSDAFDQAILIDWEKQEKGIHGEGWEAPKDWRSIMAQAQRRGPESGAEAAAGQTADRL